MTARERMIRLYDRALASEDYRSFYEDSGFYNFGYWENGAKTQREASEALIDRLVSRIGRDGGRILDVACGPGASTKHLTRSYAPEKITAINISEAQLNAARQRAPGCDFLLMDAAKLEFADAEFDAVICVEAAFHFDTRDTFLRETFRVLKPGGSIVLTDMLFRAFMKPLAEIGQVPLSNFVPNIAAYEERLKATGFEGVAVEDATESCMGGFRRHLSKWPAAEHRRGNMPAGKAFLASLIATSISQYFAAVCKTYLIASARKPADGRAVI
jgi:MPBQ/MSBQ methyltransferase